MEEIAKLPNMGKKIVEKLKLVGIETVTDLRNTGSKQTFIKLMTVDDDACINMLYALEGALQNIRWHQLDKDKKEELKDFYNMVHVGT